MDLHLVPKRPVASSPCVRVESNDILVLPLSAYMFRLAEIRKVLLGALVTLGFVAAGLVALFVMLWLALIAVISFFLYAIVRRVLPRKRPPGSGGGSEVIEGEFRIERNDRTP